jgi:hypothetical protein
MLLPAGKEFGKRGEERLKLLRKIHELVFMVELGCLFDSAGFQNFEKLFSHGFQSAEVSHIFNPLVFEGGFQKLSYFRLVFLKNKKS